MERRDITLTIGGKPRLFRFTQGSEAVCDYEHGDIKAWCTRGDFYIRLYFGGRVYSGYGDSWPSAVVAFETDVTRHVDQLLLAALIKKADEHENTQG